MNRESRHEKKLKAIYRAKFALKQRLERIDWEEDVLLPAVVEFTGKAQLPSPPSENIVDIVDERSNPSQNPQ